MNKKLIKSIASSVLGLGIVVTIPFATTSCNKPTESSYSFDKKVDSYSYEYSSSIDYMWWAYNDDSTSGQYGTSITGLNFSIDNIDQEDIYYECSMCFKPDAFWEGDKTIDGQKVHIDKPDHIICLDFSNLDSRPEGITPIPDGFNVELTLPDAPEITDQMGVRCWISDNSPLITWKNNLDALKPYEFEYNVSSNPNIMVQFSFGVKDNDGIVHMLHMNGKSNPYIFNLRLGLNS